ncbi:MAG: hypothetical protein ACI8W3_001835 [Myxococcota bacterium]|jgi:hypothetical protein
MLVIRSLPDPLVQEDVALNVSDRLETTPYDGRPMATIRPNAPSPELIPILAPPIDPYWSRSRQFGLFACLWAVILLKNPYNTFWPSLINEDGAIMFKHYYENPGLENLWLQYAGYVSVMPDLMAFFVASLPPSLVAYTYLLLATASFAIAYSAFFLPRFRAFIPNDRHRWIVCLTLALLPLGNSALMRAVTYSFWALLMVSTLICLVPGSKKSPVVWTEFILLSLNACSSPVSVILLPLLVWRAIHGRTSLETSLFVAVCLISIAYLGLAVETGGAKGDILYTALHVIPAFGDRVSFEPFLSSRLRMEFIWRGLHAVPVALGWTILLLILGGALSDRATRAVFQRERVAALWGSYCIASLTVISIYSRFGPGGLEYTSAFHQRYFWIQQCLLGLVIGIVVFSNTRIAHLLSQPRSRRVLIAGCLSYLLALNVLDLGKTVAGSGDGRTVAAFLGKLEECETTGHCVEPVSLERDWDPINSFQINRFRPN